MNDKLKALLPSRRFWAAVSGGVVVLTGGLGFPVSPEVVEQFVILIAAWILGDSITKTT